MNQRPKSDRLAQVDHVIDQMIARPTFAGRPSGHHRRRVVSPPSPGTPLLALFGNMAPQIQRGIELAGTEKGKKAALGAAVALGAILLPKL